MIIMANIFSLLVCVPMVLRDLRKIINGDFSREYLLGGICIGKTSINHWKLSLVVGNGVLVGGAQVTTI